MATIDNARAAARSACPECGGRSVGGLGCQEMFGTLLAWEWQDPELLAQHFLTVSSFQLQHPAPFTDEAIRGLQLALAGVVRGELTVEQVRWQTHAAYDGAARVHRPVSDVQRRLRTWPITIADVYEGGQAGAASRVKAWAQSISDNSELETP